MKKRFISESHYKRKIKLSTTLTLTIILISIMTFFLISKFSKKMNHTLIDIASSEINKVSYSFLTDKINNKILNKTTLEEILIINKNQKGEILYVDFNLDKAYQVLDSISNVLTSSFTSIEGGSIDIAFLDEELSHQTNSLVLSIPLGSSSNSLYFFNLGPKIPVKINFVGTVLTNLETKITNYGLNNALVEVFVYIEFTNKIIAPFETKEQTFKYNAIIASSMIQGTVPNFYNGTIERQSSIYSKNIE